MWHQEPQGARGGVRTRGGRSQGLQCSMGDTSREIGRGRGWRLPPLRRSGGGENRRGGRSQGGLQCSRVLYGNGAAAEYSTGAEECVVGSTAPVHRGAELQGRDPRKCTVREQGPQQSTVRGGGVCGGVHSTRPSGG